MTARNRNKKNNKKSEEGTNSTGNSSSNNNNTIVKNDIDTNKTTSNAKAKKDTKTNNNINSNTTMDTSTKIKEGMKRRSLLNSKNKKKKDWKETIYLFAKSPFVIGLIIIIAMVWTWDWAYVQRLERKKISDAVYYLLTSFVCKNKNGGGYCHNTLIPTLHRTQKAKYRIKPGETILVVPRHLQIWTLDAMRDKFIQDELFNARHDITFNPLDSGAFLAAYMAIRHQKIQIQQKQQEKQKSNNDDDKDDDPMIPYFNVLPTYDELCNFHPTCWRDEMIDDLLVKHSSSSILVRSYRDMINSEYDAFITISNNFKTIVSYKAYKSMRLNVLTRSFFTGPPDANEAFIDSNMSLDEELEFYFNKTGVDMKIGCHAMVPILDMYNHHAKPNVQWRYEPSKKAFVIYASSEGGIPAGHEIIDSYGKYTDAHLFAKFGFVNGDGSDYTQASIASLHIMFDLDMNNQFSYIPIDDDDVAAKRKAINKEDDILQKLYDKQKKDVLRYLAFDDGYPECIQQSSDNDNEASEPSDAYRLKEIKLKHLQLIANTPNRWIARLYPRNPSSVPGPVLSSSDDGIPIIKKVPKFDFQKLNVKFTKIVSTCRLITLTHYDYDGKAIEILQNVLDEMNETNNKTIVETFMIDRQGNELEYRALNCLARLTALSLNRFPNSPLEEEDIIRDLVATKTTTNKNSSSSNNNNNNKRNWTSAHIRLGEIQSLEVLYRITMSGMKEIKDKLMMDEDDAKHIFMRKEPCPLEYSKSLMQV